MLTFVILAALHAAPPVTADGTARLPGLTLALESIRRDTGAPCLTTTERVVSRGPQVRVARACGLEEVWTSVADSLEHELFLARAPGGRGALRIALRVEGPWHHADALGHTFAGPGAPDGWTYGEAFVVRGARREHIDVVRTPTGLELVVPAALVKFPLHIDPLVFPNAERTIAPPLLRVGDSPSESDEATPTVTWNTAGTYGLVGFSEDRRGVFPDLFGVVVSFDAGVVLSNLVPAPAAQLRPAVLSARDGGLVVAFEDYAAGPLSTPSVRVALLDEVTKVPRATELISNARAPSLTLDPQLGAVLAFAKNDSSLVMRTVDTILFEDGGVLFSVTLDGGVIEETAVASRDGHQSLMAATTLGRVRYFSDGVEVPLAAAGVGVRQLAPTVLIEGSGARWAGWTEDGLFSSTVQVRHWDPSANLTFSELNESQGALFEFQGRTMLASFSAPSAMGMARALVVHDLTGARVMGTFTLDRSGGLGELAAEARGQQILVAWTDRTPLEQRNLVVGVLRCCNGNSELEKSFFKLEAVRAQHDVAVSYFESVGLVVWREGPNQLRAQWLDVDAAPGTIFPITSMPSGTRIDGLDVSVGKDDALVVARTFQADGHPQVLTFLVPRLASGGAPGPTIDLTNTDRPGPPSVAFNGSKYWVGVRRLGGFHLVETDGRNLSNPATVASASATADSFDLDCLGGHCALAFFEATLRQVRLVADVTKPTEVVTVATAHGPVTLTNDGARFHLIWQGSSAVLVNTSFSPGDVPSSAESTTPLVDSFGKVFIATAIDGAGTQPLVVAVTDGNQPPRTHLVELGSPPPWRSFADATGARVAATGAQASTGVLVYQRFDDTRLASESMIVGWDALTRDAGGDGGADAGSGAPPGDGGVFNLTSSGCGCSAPSGGAWLVAGLTLLALLRRAHRGAALVVLVAAGAANAQVQVLDDQRLANPLPGGRLTSDARAPAVSINDAGVVVVAWVDTRRGGEDVFTMAFLPGAPSGLTRAVALSSGPTTNPALAALPDGRFALAWEDEKNGMPLLHLSNLTIDPQGISSGVVTELVGAGAPSLYAEASGAVWVGYQLDARMPVSALRVQPIDDLSTGTVNTNTLHIVFDGGVATRTVLAVESGQKVLGVETAADLAFFSNTGPVPLTLSAATTRRTLPAVQAGLAETWVAFDEVEPGSRKVTVKQFGTGGALISSIELPDFTSGALFRVGGMMTVAALTPAGAVELRDMNNSTLFTSSSLPTALDQARLVASARGNEVAVGWEQGTSPRRSISAAALTRLSQSQFLERDLSPTAPASQRGVRVSFNPSPVAGQLRGVAAWQVGTDGVAFAWLESTMGSRALTAHAPRPLFVPSTSMEVVELDVAMGNVGALVVVRTRLNAVDMQRVFWVNRATDEVTSIVGSAGSGAPVAVFADGFTTLWTDLLENLVLSSFVDDGAAAPPPVRPLTQSATNFDLDCLPGPMAECLVLLKSNLGWNWMFLNRLMLSPVDANLVAEPLGVTHDSNGRFFAVWKRASQARLVLATVRSGESQLTIDGGIQFGGRDPLTLRMAPGDPPWLVTADVNADVRIARVLPGATPVSIASGRAPDISSLAQEELAVVAYTGFDQVSASMLPRVALVEADSGLPLRDGGTPFPQTDGGSSDAGGLSDGGADADAGAMQKFDLKSMPCGCDSSGGSLVALALALAALARKPSAR